jgi:hypothetical protein
MMRNTSEHCWRLCRSIVVTVVALGICLGADASTSSAGPKTAPHCITPTAVDLNERYGVSEAIVAFFCTEINSGQPWTVTNAWFVSPTFDAVPDGFVPAGTTPLEDYIAKFIGIKYVVDPGTSKEKAYVIGNNDDLGIVDGGVIIAVNPVSLGALEPLSVGDHVVDSYLLFTAMHCDGFADIPEDNCIQAGETLWSSVQFTVTPGHH